MLADSTRQFVPHQRGVGWGLYDSVSVYGLESSGWSESMCDSLILPSTGHENNIGQPKTGKWLSSPSHFLLFNC